MPWYVYVLQFVSGLLLANGIPHFVQGVSGHRFQSPFASPPGVGESSPLRAYPKVEGGPGGRAAQLGSGLAP